MKFLFHFLGNSNVVSEQTKFAMFSGFSQFIPAKLLGFLLEDFFLSPFISDLSQLFKFIFLCETRCAVSIFLPQRLKPEKSSAVLIISPCAPTFSSIV